MAVGAYLTRTTLLRNNFHRRMIVAALATIVGSTVGRVIVTGAGFPVALSLVIEMLLVGQVFLVAGFFISKMLLPICLLFWVAAAVIAYGGPGIPTTAVCSLLGLGAFTFVWTYGPRRARARATPTSAS